MPDADFWNQKQVDAIQWASFTTGQEYCTLSTLANAIGTSVLTARYSLAGGLSGPLPSDQWQVEIEHMVGASLASLQGTFVEAANGPATEDLKQFQVLPDTAEAHRMCTSQKIRSALYSSTSCLSQRYLALEAPLS